MRATTRLDAFLPDWVRAGGPQAVGRHRMLVAFCLLTQPVLLFFGVWIAVVPRLPLASASVLTLSGLLIAGPLLLRHAPFRFPLEAYVSSTVFILWVALSVLRGGFPYYVCAWGAILPVGFALLGRPRLALATAAAMVLWMTVLYVANLNGLVLPAQEAPGEAPHRNYFSVVLLVAMLTLFAVAHARTNARVEADRRQLEEGLRRSQRLESLGRLAGSMAHEFNNLLSAVGASAETLSSSTDPQAREEGGHIQQVVRRGALLTRELMAFGRNDATTPETLELNEVVAQVRPLLERAAGGDTRLRLDLHPRPVWVRVDRLGVEQILMNLVINARDAMPSGGTVTIETALAPAEEEGLLETDRPQVVLRVRDRGEGMSQEVLVQAFEPFFTTKPRNQGTGLGLSTVARIVDHVGGRVWARSTPGQGTTVIACFPQADPGETPAAEASLAPPPVAEPGTVLLVEDDDRLRRAFERVLGRQGYDVYTASDGREALALWDRLGEKVQAVVTDVLMPGMGGRDLVAELRNRVPELPVVFISGYSEGALEPGDVPPCRTRFLAKPFRSQDLLANLAELRAVSEEDPPCREGREAPGPPDSERSARRAGSDPRADASSPPPAADAPC